MSKLVTKFIAKGDNVMFLDMTLIGLKKHPIVIMTSANQMTEAISYFTNSPDRDRMFQSVVKELCLKYTNLDRLKHNKELQEEFNADCVLYSAGRHVLHNKDLPLTTIEELEAKGMKIDCVEFGK